MRWQMSTLLQVEVFETPMVVHVVVHSHKFITQSLENIQIAPSLRPQDVKMEFRDNLVDMIQQFSREILEEEVFSPFCVKFQDNMLLDHASTLENIPEGVEHIVWSGLRYFPDAYFAEHV